MKPPAKLRCARRSCFALLELGVVPIHSQQLLIEFADGFENLLDLVVALQRLAYLRNLFGVQTEPTCLGAGIVDIELPERVALGAGALGAAGGVMNAALQEGAGENLGRTGRSGGELVAALEGLLTRHLCVIYIDGI
jgi:hypothetical protein